MKLNRWLLAMLCVSSLPAANLLAAPQGESKSITITATVGDEDDAKADQQSKGEPKDGSEKSAPKERKTLRLQLNNGPVVMLKRQASSDAPNDDQASDQDYKEAKARRVWLGIVLKKVEGDLEVYLGSSEGVFVDHVFPDSPAAEAKLQIGDVLIAFNGDKISGLADMMEHLRAIKPIESKGQASDQAATYSKVTLTALRRGQEVKLELTPRDRPDKVKTELSDTVEKELPDVAKIFKFGSPADADLNLVKPFTKVKNNAVIVMKENGKDTTVRIERDGEGPAKIVVVDGNSERELTEEQLDQLPEKVRDAVQKVLKDTQSLKFKSSPHSSHKVPESGQVRADAEQAFDEVRAQLEKAMKQVGGGAELGLKDLSESLKGLEKGRVIIIDPEKLQDVRKMSEDAQQMAKKWAEAGATQARSFATMPDQVKQLKDQVDDLKKQLKEQVEELKKQLEELREEAKASKK